MAVLWLCSNISSKKTPPTQVNREALRAQQAQEPGQPLGRAVSSVGDPPSGPDTHRVHLLDWPCLRSAGHLE